MKQYRYSLFDLDGTLTDSGEGITKSAQYALSKMGIREPDLSRLKPFVGPPLMDSFRQFYGMSEEEGEKAVRYYRERYESAGLFECQPYPGIPELLAELHERGMNPVVASSKPEYFVRKILEHFHLDPYFTEAVGPGLDERHPTKKDIICEVFRRCGIREDERKETVMIGDRRYDIEGARSTGIDSIGVYYGFAEPGELEKAGATCIADTVKDLSDILLKLRER